MNNPSDSAKEDYVRKWMIKADNDLPVAKDERYLKKENIITDAICFHCQQTVENHI
jgi:HEPN domain-containing protein